MNDLGATFEPVLAAARTGAEWAWRDLYRSTAPDLLRYAEARSATDPEDVVGEVFIRAVHGLASFEGGEGAFRGWLFTLARNIMIDRHRVDAHRRTLPTPSDDLARLGPSGDAEAEALDRLSVDGIRRLLDHLSPDQRDVLLLRILAGLTIVEVAAVLGKRPGAVKALQARGVRAVQAEISRGAVTL